MPVAAKRYEFLDKQTNVGVADFASVKSADILNSTQNEVKDYLTEVTANAQTQFQSTLDEINEQTKELQDGAKAAFREVKGLYSTVQDLKSLSETQLDKYIVGMFPDNALVRSILAGVSRDCKQQAFGRRPQGRGMQEQNDCNGSKNQAGTSSCETQPFARLLNSVTGGQYNFSTSRYNQTVGATVSLASFGYKLNMCKVFDALTSAATGQVRSRSAAMLLNDLSKSQLTEGVFDLASSTAGMSYKAEVTNPAMLVSQSVKIPETKKEIELSGFYDRVTASLEVVDENWDKAEVDNRGSIAKIEVGEDLQKLAKASVMAHSRPVPNLSQAYVPTSAVHTLMCSRNSLKRPTKTRIDAFLI